MSFIPTTPPSHLSVCVWWFGDRCGCITHTLRILRPCLTPFYFHLSLSSLTFKSQWSRRHWFFFFFISVFILFYQCLMRTSEEWNLILFNRYPLKIVNGIFLVDDTMHRALRTKGQTTGSESCLWDTFPLCKCQLSAEIRPLWGQGLLRTCSFFHPILCAPLSLSISAASPEGVFNQCSR